MPLRLRLRLAILLILLAPLVTAADDAPSHVDYSPNWLTLTDADPAFAPARPLFESGDPIAVRTLLNLALRSDLSSRRVAQLAGDDDFAAPLIADLDRLYWRDLAAWQPDVVRFLDLIGPRRAGAARLLVHICDDPPFPRAFAIAATGLLAPAERPRILATLIDFATGPDDHLATAALNRLSRDDPAVQPALATIVARCTAQGLHDRATAVASTMRATGGDNPADHVATALRTALHSSIDDAQRLRLLAAAYDLRTFDGIDDAHPLVRDLAVLTRTPRPINAAPIFRSQIRTQLMIASAAARAARETGAAFPPDALARLRSDPNVTARALASALGSQDVQVRFAAVRSLQTLDPRALLVHEPAVARVIRADPDPRVRAAAVALLGDDHALALARVPDLIADCRADSPTLRETAARQLEEIALFPAPVTAALRRAVAARDMAAREGLLRALERAFAAQSDPLLSLQSAADAPDSATRAYARAALRELAPARTPP
jgi:hypothetical protein